jgi:regulator of RNase E activity RraA
VDYRCPVEIGAVHIEPGDLIFADMDGVLVVPRAIEEEAVARALEKARGEKVVRKEIEAGLSSTEAFRKHGIL